MGRSAPDGRASGNQELECSSELRRTGRANVLFDGTFADVRLDAQRRRSACLGSLVAQLFRRRNDADLRTAGDIRLRTSDVR